MLQVAEEVSKVQGVQKILLADNEAFQGLLAGQSAVFFDITL